MSVQQSGWGRRWAVRAKLMHLHSSEWLLSCTHVPMFTHQPSTLPLVKSLPLDRLAHGPREEHKALLC